VYYRVTRNDGALLVGYADLPTANVPALSLQPTYADGKYHGDKIRIVAIKQPVPARGGMRQADVAVAETLKGRIAMSRQIWLGIAVEQFLLVAVACGLAWIVLKRVLAPLLRLTQEVRDRQPNDFVPFTVRSLQAELDPLVNALNRYMMRLRSQLDAQRRFTENAAHQLRTPLTLLRTQASFAMRTSSEAERTTATRAILGTTQQITRMTNQLLSLAKAERSGSPARRDRLDLVNVTRGILEEYGSLAVDRGIDLAFDVASSGCAIVDADPTMLHDLVVNLLDNALRYTPLGGCVSVSIRSDDGRCVLVVEDTGPGIPESQRTLVFERFYRLAATDTEGSGLGLAIVREILDAHAGTIALRAGSDGRGLVVEIALPEARTDAELGRNVAERGRTPLEQSMLHPR